MIHPDFEDWTRYAMVAITTRNVPIPRLGFGTFRIPLLFDAMVANGRLGLRNHRDHRDGTGTAYGLTTEGSVTINQDADLAVWEPSHKVTLTDDLVANRTGFMAYTGRTITGWPTAVLRRGEIVAQDGAAPAQSGSGRWLKHL